MNLEELNKDISGPKVARRGFDIDDDKWFSEEAVLKLQTAQEELQWLLSRGYKTESVMNLIGSHYQLSVRQRNALQRATSSIYNAKSRREKMLSLNYLQKEPIYIDGFNLIITLEVALSSSILVLGNDGAIRDIAGLRGTYSIIDKTDSAIELIGKAFNHFNVSKAIFYLDSPVSNSGRLKGKILQHATSWLSDIDVELVKNPDPILSEGSRVVTSDSIILDNCRSWFNLSSYIIREYIKASRIIDLSGKSILTSEQ